MAKLAVDGVVDALRSMILDGKHGPGDRLDETTLVGRFDVSRNTLREAFRVLAHEHIVEHLPNRGVFVRRLTLKEARDVCRTKRLLECGALREAALRRVVAQSMSSAQRQVFEHDWQDTVVAIQRAVQTGLDAQAGGDWEGVGKANGQFHLALAELAGNDVISRTVGSLIAEMRLLSLVVADALDGHERYLDENLHIATLVETGELIRAGIALEDYLLRAEQHLVGRYSEYLVQQRLGRPLDDGRPSLARNPCRDS
jgi:DNA-binding GntR family transcriptional regulator